MLTSSPFISFILYGSCKFQIRLFLQCLGPDGRGDTSKSIEHLLSGSALGVLYSHFTLLFHKNSIR